MELSLAPSGHSSTPHKRDVSGSSVLHRERLFVSFSQAVFMTQEDYVQIFQGPLQMMTKLSYPMVQLFSYLCHINGLN